MINVGIAEIVFAEKGILRTILGSCVAVVLYDRDGDVLPMVSLAHILLNKAPREIKKSILEQGNIMMIGKYADTAIPYMVNHLRQKGARNLLAKIAGGAFMFSGKREVSTIDVGKKNIIEVVRLLADYQIPVAGKDLGGRKGRVVEFNVQTRQMKISFLDHQDRPFYI